MAMEVRRGLQKEEEVTRSASTAASAVGRTSSQEERAGQKIRLATGDQRRPRLWP